MRRKDVHYTDPDVPEKALDDLACITPTLTVPHGALLTPCM